MRLAVRVKPGARKDAIVGWEGDELVVSVAAPAVEGKANEALVAFLAAEWGLRKRDVVIVRGEAARHKLVEVPDGTGVPGRG
ncbi:MAG: DUF167 domain-containing protein [Myxococcota bacterium]